MHENYLYNSRLLSAWRDKFQFKDPQNKKHLEYYGRQIIRTFRANATEEALRTGQGVTFQEFLQFITMTGRVER